MWNRGALHPLLERSRLPEGWLWGVGTSGYQVEGGINGPGDPQNNWRDWERAGHIEPPGLACRFWDEPSLLLDAAAAAGCNTFRLGIEWSRVAPTPDGYDAAALDHYAEVLAACHARGLRPIVCCWHFTHPRWMGLSPWVGAAAEAQPERFRDYAATLARELGVRLVARGLPPVDWWLTLNELNIAAVASYLVGMAPPGRRGDTAGAAEMLDTLATAHVLAYDAIHDTYEQQGWATPVVTTNNTSVAIYELDWMLVDVLSARQRGVGLDTIEDDLEERKRVFDEEMRRAPRVLPGSSRRAFESLLLGYAGRRLRAPLPRTRAALAASGRARKLDVIAFDYYDPFAAHVLHLPGRRAPNGSRVWRPEVRLWENQVNPVGLLWFLRTAGQYGTPVVLMENGMCTQDGWPRKDGWDRVSYLQANLASVLRALDEGVDVLGYLHWSIADNWEWGSYVPRFGLHRCERDSRSVRLYPTDATGMDAAGSFRSLVEALSTDDLGARLAAFEARS